MSEEKLTPLPASGYVYADSKGEIWWQPQNLNKPAQLLADSDSICGKIVETTEDDPFRDACSWHDHAYRNRAWYEYMGVSFSKVNEIFYDMMLKIAGDNKVEQLRALTYYSIVCVVGRFLWDRHPAYDGKTIPI